MRAGWLAGLLLTAVPPPSWWPCLLPLMVIRPMPSSAFFGVGPSSSSSLQQALSQPPAPSHLSSPVKDLLAPSPPRASASRHASRDGGGGGPSAAGPLGPIVLEIDGMMWYVREGERQAAMLALVVQGGRGWADG